MIEDRLGAAADRIADTVVARLEKRDVQNLPVDVVTRAVEIVEGAIPAAELAAVRREPQRAIARVRAILVDRLMSDAAWRRSVYDALGWPVRARQGRRRVFASYRRSASEDFVARLKRALEESTRFVLEYDQEILGPGPFPPQLGRRIRACHVFLIVIAPGALERTSDPTDWMRREIETALDAKRHIVALLTGGAKMPAEESLPISIRSIAQNNALTFPSGYFDEAVHRLAAGLERLVRSAAPASSLEESPLPER